MDREIEEAGVTEFLGWLTDHGARFPNILGPSDVGCGRGAIALEDIMTNDYILEIPHVLMMTPLHAFEEPSIGHILFENKSILHGDTLLAVFIMCEVLKGRDSFYYPYLNILPEPQSVCGWSESEVCELQVGAVSV
jgi:hypothetical protein